MEKLRISLPVIVEGKYDKIRLSGILDAAIITTAGFGVFNHAETRALIRTLAAPGCAQIMWNPASAKDLLPMWKAYTDESFLVTNSLSPASTLPIGICGSMRR